MATTHYVQDGVFRAAGVSIPIHEVRQTDTGYSSTGWALRIMSWVMITLALLSFLGRIVGVEDPLGNLGILILVAVSVLFKFFADSNMVLIARTVHGSVKIPARRKDVGLMLIEIHEAMEGAATRDAVL